MSGNEFRHEHFPAVGLVTPGKQILQRVHHQAELTMNHGRGRRGLHIQAVAGIEFTNKVLDQRFVIRVERIQAELDSELHNASLSGCPLQFFGVG